MRRWLRPTTHTRVLFFMGVDLLLSLSTLYGAYLLRFNFRITEGFLDHFWSVAAVLLTLKWGFFWFFKNYSIVWRYFGLLDAKRLLLAHIGVYLSFFIIFSVFPSLFSPFPRSVIVIDFVLSFLFLGGVRFSKRLIVESNGLSITDQRAVIIGIASDIDMHIKSITKEGYNLSAIIAVRPSNYSLIGSFIRDIKIISLHEMEKLISFDGITTAIVDGSLSQDELRLIHEKLHTTPIRHIKRLITSGNLETSFVPLCVEDLLARHPKDLNIQTINNFIDGKSVLITGAGGSIGSEISLQCHAFGASALILVDHSEYNLYQIAEKIPQALPILCNIVNKESFETLVATHKPDILIHAAAYKHVPLCESNIQSALLNNIQGSRIVIDSAIKNNVAKIVIISTDKAVRPTNVMGTTKRIVELYAQNVDPKNSEIVAVRFGNVLGSSGSVIPKFKAQIQAGGPLTLTHPDITRYFMLIGEACQLVLQAAAIARGGELFILDMGEPIKIIDLAHTMIKLYAKEPIEIQMTGLRAGEKLYEELLMNESEQKTRFESIMIAGSTHYPIDQLNRDIDVLLNNNNPIDSLKQIVPEFTPKG